MRAVATTTSRVIVVGVGAASGRHDVRGWVVVVVLGAVVPIQGGMVIV